MHATLVSSRGKRHRLDAGSVVTRFIALAGGLVVVLLAASSCKKTLEPVPSPDPSQARRDDLADPSTMASTSAPTTAAASATPAAVSAPVDAALAVLAFPAKMQGGGPLEIRAEVVASEARIQRGLMHRTFMPDDQGMLFLMGFESEHTFWMHNTLIPLDMIFIGKDKRVVGVVERAEPKTDTSRHVQGKSFYVLEMNGGWAAKHGVGAGDAISFDDAAVLRVAK